MGSNKKAYYAHPMSTYDCDIELEDIRAIQDAGFDVLNPNQKEHDQGARKEGMDYFRMVVLSCDVLFFRAFPDGSIGSGVAKEIGWAKEKFMPIFELPRMIEKRSLSIKDTVMMLNECGRKKKKK